MPFLLPPPEFKPGELTQMGLTGTCEMQICRSAGPWSMGTPSRIEHSIQNAYLKGLFFFRSGNYQHLLNFLQPFKCQNTLCTLKISSSSHRKIPFLSS